MQRMISHEHLRYAGDVSPSSAVASLRECDLGSVGGIDAATRMFERLMPDYIRPAAHGFGVVQGSGEVIAAVTNGAGHDLPAMLLAAICGYRSGTEAVAFSVAQLRLAVAAMEPAEACRAYRHPNIAAWRQILRDLRHGSSDTAVAVFAGVDWAGSSNPIVRRFFLQTGTSAQEGMFAP